MNPNPRILKVLSQSLYMLNFTELNVAEVIFSKRGLDVNMIERESELDKIAVFDFLKYQVPFAESLLE